MTSFVTNESGAVTVDWVAMTAALVGLGLAVSATVSGGMEDLSGDTRDAMIGVSIRTAFDKIFAATDFEDGTRGDWTAGQVLTDVPGFGNILAFSSGQPSGTLPIEVESKYSHARIEFDMIIGDSWDNEQGRISIGGEDIVIATHAWASTAPEIQTFEGPGDATVTLTRSTTGTGIGNATWQNNNDYTYRVSIVSRNDGRDLTLGAATNLNQGASDEFFGIDNVVVTGTQDG
ncbi:hypothetical protein [Jannaschia seohaensis]|uniref:Uncharacterized protein n=1 Tax=Jannaschia seohaensis TaxID=475081 RepID=A0A2Y9B579_9RHOB|nr:hypothetical protein [Jannaschia seohaensis]PWJ13342.1 hypothetical protein BCF38_114105 [Jannaschia seohaensis]SSA50668.1 hypothetical protein SAMN05421539_114105 [Jannaschia seohaensis]